MKIDAARDNFPKIECSPPVKKVAHTWSKSSWCETSSSRWQLSVQTVGSIAALDHELAEVRCWTTCAKWLDRVHLLSLCNFLA